MFNGYLALGCNEILNQQRAYSYIEGSDCPVGWLRCAPCPSLNDALGLPPFGGTVDNSAPWYDAEDEATSRFYGLYPLAIEGITDSTRTATITEGILNGGVVQGLRHAVREVRVRALAVARGMDALESGLSWLDHALDPDECAQHGTSCGAVDAQFFVSCPPPRGSDEQFSEWELSSINIVQNPNMAMATGSVLANVPTPPVGEATSAQVSSGGIDGGPFMRATIGTTGPVFIPITDAMPITAQDATVMFLVRPNGRDVTATPRLRGEDGPVQTFPADVWTQVRFLLPAGAGASNTTGLYLADAEGHAAGETIDIDRVLISEEVYTGPYFDGDTPTQMLDRYEWIGGGPAGASAWSTRTVIEVPWDDEEYTAVVDPLVRVMHGVTAISGPFVTKEYRRGEVVAFEVEFTLAVSTPFVFGLPRTLDLSPTSPVLIEDLPVNLAPYPSAELPSATQVTVARNFSANPSVETDASSWVGSSTTLTGSTMSTYFTSQRVTVSGDGAIAANGNASFRTRVLGNGSTAASGTGYMSAYQEVSLASVVAGQGVSFNIWGAVTINAGAGASAITELRAYVEWRNAVPTVLRTDVLGITTTPTDYSGIVFQAKSLLPPAGATVARVIVRASVTWASSATAGNNSDIRMYTDALAVTVP